MEQFPSTAPTVLPRAPRYSYYALSVLTLVNFLNYIDRQVLPAVAPARQRDLGLTDTEIGAMEAALLLSFTVLAPLFGWLGDRYSRTRLMASAAVVWSIATGLAAWLDKSPLLPPAMHLRIPFFGLIGLSSVAAGLCGIRALVCIGESSYSTITPALIPDHLPRQRRLLCSALSRSLVAPPELLAADGLRTASLQSGAMAISSFVLSAAVLRFCRRSSR